MSVIVLHMSRLQTILKSWTKFYQKLKREQSVVYFCEELNFNTLVISTNFIILISYTHLPTRVNKVTGTYNHTNDLEN